MAGPVELLSLTNPVFKSFVFWVGVLVIKMLAMSLLTAIQRFKTKVRGGRYQERAQWGQSLKYLDYAVCPYL